MGVVTGKLKTETRGFIEFLFRPDSSNRIPGNKRYVRLVNAFRDIMKETSGELNALPSSPGGGSSARIFEKDGQAFLTVHEPHGPMKDWGLSLKTLKRVKEKFQNVGWTPEYFGL